jgi:sugar (pentulose or hexulose) kinase
MSLLMGIDLDSVNIKATIYNEQGDILVQGKRPTLISHPHQEHPLWAVWDPEAIWRSVCNSIKDALSQVRDRENIVAVSVTGFGMDGTAVDKSGEALYPFISWHCPRTEPQSRAFSEALGNDTIFNISGKQVMPIDSIYRMIWMKENHPEILDKAHKWLLIEDYINMKLCGEMATDFSMASSTSVLEQKTRDWSNYLIDKAGIPRDLFTDIKSSGTVLGSISSKAGRQTGLALTTKVVLGGHDYHCAALSVGGYTPDVILDIIGTWEIILQPSREIVINNDIFNHGITSESHVAKDTYNLAIYSLSGEMVEWFKKNFTATDHIKDADINEIWETQLAEAQSVPLGSNGVFFGPYRPGADSAIMDYQARGSFMGLTNNSDKAVLTRALHEGLNYQFRDMLSALENATGINAEKVISIGGAAENSFWMQNKADISGKSIESPQIEDATSLGAAMLAGIGVGIYKDEEDAYSAVKKESKIFEPDNENHKQYSDLFEIYKDIYSCQNDINRKIDSRFKV